jgi:hypothetical protein
MMFSKRVQLAVHSPKQCFIVTIALSSWISFSRQLLRLWSSFKEIPWRREGKKSRREKSQGRSSEAGGWRTRKGNIHRECLWCYSECISTPGRVEKYAWPRWESNLWPLEYVTGSIPTVARHIFQACLVWIYTQSNITSILYSPEYITPTQKIFTENFGWVGVRLKNTRRTSTFRVKSPRREVATSGSC